MWTYVTEELPALIEAQFPADMARQGIMGHSMGGHGALTIGLTHPDRYRSVSALRADRRAERGCRGGEKALGRVSRRRPLTHGGGTMRWR